MEIDHTEFVTNFERSVKEFVNIDLTKIDPYLYEVYCYQLDHMLVTCDEILFETEDRSLIERIEQALNVLYDSPLWKTT